MGMPWNAMMMNELADELGSWLVGVVDDEAGM